MKAGANERIIGTDWRKTLMLVINLVLLIATWKLLEGMYKDNITLKYYAEYTDYSFWLTVIGILIALFAMLIGSYVKKAEPINCKWLCTKLLLDISTIIFFLMLCSWIIICGGLLKSPYSSVLTISAIYKLLQFLETRDFLAHLRSNLGFIWKNLIRILNYLPFVIIGFTISLGEFCIALSMDQQPLTNLIATEWYRYMSYILFYISLVSVILALPITYKKHFSPQNVQTNP